MNRNTFLVICFISVTIAASARADDAATISILDNASDHTIMPVGVEKFEMLAKAGVDIKNAVEGQGNNVTSIAYDDNGRIANIVFANGDKVSYSYQFDEEGSLSTCNMAFTKGDGGETRNITVTNSDLNGDGKLTNDDKEIIIVIKPDAKNPPAPSVKRSNPIESIARTPARFDFDAIMNGLERAHKEKKDGYRSYMKDSDSYYEKTLQALIARRDNMESEQIGLGIETPKTVKGKVFGKEDRTVIEDAVKNIRREVERASGERTVAREFLILEDSYRVGILDPSKAVYDGRVKKAQEYLSGVIDELAASNLTLYMKKKNDKIEVVINLPQINEEPQETK